LGIILRRGDGAIKPRNHARETVRTLRSLDPNGKFIAQLFLSAPEKLGVDSAGRDNHSRIAR
jgi:hypothetical protein